MQTVEQRIARLGIARRVAVEPVPQWQYKLRQAEMARDAADAQLLRVQTAMADIQDALDRARRHA